MVRLSFEQRIVRRDATGTVTYASLELGSQVAESVLEVVSIWYGIPL